MNQRIEVERKEKRPFIWVVNENDKRAAGKKLTQTEIVSRRDRIHFGFWSVAYAIKKRCSLTHNAYEVHSC